MELLWQYMVVSQLRKKKEQDEKEEEQMAVYNNEDLRGWEFKIMRSAFGKFKNYEYLQKVCQEEAQAGWEMVEKFDNNRVRFKRKIDRRTNDSHLGRDPYRISASFGQSHTFSIIIALLLLLVGAAVLGMFYLR